LLEGFRCSVGGLADDIAQDIARRQSEFDKINAAFDRAEVALETVRARTDELRRKSDLAKSPDEIAALHLEAAEILQQIVKITTAVHAGNSAPHLRLVPDTE
jgi:predicted  nucleic acid-binding Zn-ribbon protein